MSTGLVLVVDETDHPVTVKVAQKATGITSSTSALPAGTGDNVNYTLTANSGADNLTVSFKSKYILAQTEPMAVQVTYYAKITEAALNHNVNPTSNTVTVEYSNDPTDNTGYGVLKDVTNQYSFSIDASLFGDKETPHNTAARLAVPFPPCTSCNFLDLPPASLRNLQARLTENSLASQPP